MNSFPVPPQKISCGLFQSFCITNAPPPASTKLDQSSGKLLLEKPYDSERDEAYVWGRNAPWNLCGAGDPKKIDEVSNPFLLKEDILPRTSEDQPASGAPPVQRVPYEVACGANHSMILVKAPTEDGGDLYAMGLGNHGRLGASDPRNLTGGEAQDTWFCPSGEDTPKADDTREAKEAFAKAKKALLVVLPLRQSVLRVACGADHSMCIAVTMKTQRRKSLFAWGLNTEGQCGQGHLLPVVRPEMVEYPGFDKYIDCGHFACGARHSLMCTAILPGGAGNSGLVYSWGCNQQGRLGLGHSKNSSVPVLVDAVKSLETKRVACGEAHSGALCQNNTLWTWGAGSYGRLGLGEPIDVPIPRMTDPPLADMTWKALALGGFHSVALASKPSSKVFTWGMGDALGTLPPGDTTLVMKPRPVTLPETSGPMQLPAEIAAGTYHTLILLDGGHILAFGLGANGRLGTGKTKNESMPKLIKHAGFVHKFFGKVYAKFQHDSERLVEGSVKEDAEDITKQPWAIKQVCCGLMHTVAVTQAGDLYAWGWPAKGQCGIKAKMLKEEDKKSAIWSAMKVDMPKPVKLLAMGYEHCLAIASSGELFAWGRGSEGQLGIGPARDAFFPTPVVGQHGGFTDVMACAAGEEHSVAVQRGDDFNTVFAWGSAEMGKLGLGEDHMSGTQPQVTEVKSTFRKEGDDGNPIDVCCGQNHTVLIVEDRDANAGGKHVLWSCGGGWYGRLGLGGKSNKYKFDKVKMDASARTVSCGAFHSASISLENKDEHAPGQLYVWGRQKLVCHQEDILEPTPFTYFEGAAKCVTVACGMMHTIVVTDSQEIFAWGENTMGQLGLGVNNRPHHSSPEQMKTLPGSVLGSLLSAGPTHTMAVLQNGDLYGWGNQSCGRLGLQEKQQLKVCATPMKVHAEWASIEAMSSVISFSAKDNDAESDKSDGEEAAKAADADVEEKKSGIDTMLDCIKAGQKVKQFATMQTLLQQEPEAAKQQSLTKKENELIRLLAGYSDAINKIPELETAVERLKSDISQSFGANLKFNGGKQIKPEQKQIVNPEITRKLILYEELLWVLQQQACYLAQLSMCIKGADIDVFMNLVSHLYHDLEDERTLHLFIAMLKTMVFKEIEKEKELKNVFNPETSIVFRVFRWFALKEVHYKDVVHKLMDTTKKNDPPEDKPTEVVKTCLLGALVEATNQDKKFVLTIEEFRKISQHGDEQKDNQEILAEYNQGLERFKEFMLGDFMRTIKDCDMHDNLRKIWAYCYKQLVERGFQPDPTNTSITAELQILIPLLNLFVKGFLAVLVADPVKYAGKEVYLAHCAKDANDEAVRLNCKGLHSFLESMMQDDGSGDVSVYNNSRLLASVAKSLKPDLLKYLKDQANVEDDTDTMLVIDVYVAHFSRMSKVVSVPTSILLKLSNILSREQAKIQLHSNDPVGIICTNIGNWEPDMIQSAEKNDMLHNFHMNTRFLFNRKDLGPNTPALVIDRTSHCPVPFKLSSTQDKQSGDASIVNRYVVKTASADQKAKMELENLLREMDVVEASDFTVLKQEIDKMLKVATSKSPPNYGLAHKFTDGLHRIEDLERLECSPESLLDFIGSALTQRSNHRMYLEQVQVGTTKIKEAKAAYMKEIEDAKTHLNRALKISMSLKLPREIIMASREHGAILMYDKCAQKIQSLDPFGRQPALLSKCSYSPVAEFSMAKLKKTGVVEGAIGNLKRVEHQMQLTFTHTADGGVEVMCMVHAKGVTSAVKHIKISGDLIVALRRADGGDKISLPEEDEKNCIVFNSVGLVGLITKLSTGL